MGASAAATNGAYTGVACHPIGPTGNLRPMSEAGAVAEEVRHWGELVAYLQAHHLEVRTHGDGLVRFTYRLGDQDLSIGGYVQRGSVGAWLVLLIKLAPREEVRPRPALIANYDLPVGAVAIFADEAVVRQSLPLDGWTPSSLEQTLKALAKVAVELRAARMLTDDDGPSDAAPRYAYIYR